MELTFKEKMKSYWDNINWELLDKIEKLKHEK